MASRDSARHRSAFASALDSVSGDYNGEKRLVGPLGSVLATAAGGGFFGAYFGVVGGLIGTAIGLTIGIIDERARAKRRHG